MATFSVPTDPNSLDPFDEGAPLDDRAAMQLFHVPHFPFCAEGVAGSARRAGDIRTVVYTPCAEVS